MPKRVVIVGGGFAGLTVARGLKGADAEVLLIDHTNHHLFQPLLYQVASAALSPADIAVPIREILRDQQNTTVLMGKVEEVKAADKAIRLGSGETISYDYLVLAVGARHSYFGNDGWEQHAPGLKTLRDALSIRQHLLMSFEKAERLENQEKVAPYLNFVVIGGGPTGVEMAGAIAEIAYKTLLRNFRKISPQKAQIWLVEALPEILPAYSPSLAAKARLALEELGVKVLTGKKVTSITEDGVQVEDLFLPSHNIIWAAGNQASPLLKTIGVPLDRQGRTIVEPDLSVPGYPDLFVIGDAAHCKDAKGNPLPGMAPPAIQQGKFLAKLLKAELSNKPKRTAFSYFDKGSMATIGRFRAIAQVGKLQCSGMLAWLAWCFIHILYLIGFRNRFFVLMQWLYTLTTSQRGARLIYRCIEDELRR